MVAPHNVCTLIGTMGAVHAASAMSNLIAAGVSLRRGPMVEQPCERGKPLVQNGYIELTDKPGLGVEVDEDEDQKHLWEGGDHLRVASSPSRWSRGRLRMS
ncbi:MAG: enolase C-terminal domain-like protein [Candidatus Bathyarchaeia archaeon]